MVIDLYNGVTGIMFTHENAGEVIDFVSEHTNGNPLKVIQYVPKYNTYIFGRGKHILLDGTYVIFVESKGKFLLKRNNKWIAELNV